MNNSTQPTKKPFDKRIFALVLIAFACAIVAYRTYFVTRTEAPTDAPITAPAQPGTTVDPATPKT
ncbi:MAG: hypothetical protein EOP09_13650 [Proteobacteria bacterium]|nr:MAG: hypothetical protein EOP09_13650 [Pseudomonadota bacterium]